MFLKVSKFVLSSVLSLLILLSGTNFSVKKHICLHPHSEIAFENENSCCVKNTFDKTDNINSCCSENEETTCCDEENLKSIFNFSSNKNLCKSNCCIFIESVYIGKNIEQQANGKIKIEPIFQFATLKANEFTAFFSFPPPKIVEVKEKLRSISIPLFVLFRVFRI